ncbi:hypothetical protein Hanom_Chr10g00921621 [Helianthus anomalus]
MTTAIETPVVSTAVCQSPITSNIHTQAIILSSLKIHTKSPPPKKVYTRKRKFQVHDDNIPAPVPISSKPYNVTKPQPFILPELANPIKYPTTLVGFDLADLVPLTATYPLKLHVVKEEMKQFYLVDDPSK